MNNKGFAISSVLYIMLASFLMYLAVLLSQLSSSADIIGNADNDLIDKGISAYLNNPPTDDKMIVIIKNDKKLVWPRDFNQIIEEGIIKNDQTSPEFSNISVLCGEPDLDGDEDTEDTEDSIDNCKDTELSDIDNFIICDGDCESSSVTLNYNN